MTIRFLLDTHYAEKRTDEAFWKPRIEAVLDTLQIRRESLKITASDGTNVIFAFGKDSFLKVYTPFYRGRESLGMECHSLRSVQRSDPGFPAPRVTYSGELSPNSTDWKWPFVIVTKVEGVAADDIFESFDAERKSAFAFEAGRLCKRLHSTTSTQELSSQYKSNFSGGFLEFLTRQRDEVALSPSFSAFPLSGEIRSVDLGSFAPKWPVLVHGDICRSHVFVNEAGLSLIDFGDAKLADPVWDFVTVSNDLLGRNPSLLNDFLEGYGGTPELYDQFHRKIGLYAILHEWSGWFDKEDNIHDDENSPYNWLIQSGATNLEELGQWYWPS